MPHIHHFYDFTITAVIIFDNKILVVNHPRYKKWLFPGGHIELDEDPDQALFREVKEETGLEVTVLSQNSGIHDAESKPLFTPNFIDSHEANLPHKHISLIYFCAAKSDKSVMSDEHTDMKWLTLQELAEPQYEVSESRLFYAKAALEAARS